METHEPIDHWYEDRHARQANYVRPDSSGPCQHKWRMISNVTEKCILCEKLQQIDF